MTGCTLITGADGYLGRWLATRLLDRGSDVILTVRASDRTELARKRAALAPVLDAGRPGRSSLVASDVTEADPFAEVDTRLVTRIVHAAAVTRFAVDRPTARAVNVTGTRHVCDLAGRCPDLDRLVVLSTIYSTGRTSGCIEERQHDGAAGFANNYEWSKWSAEELALTYADRVPVNVLRLATVVADDAGGCVTQQNAFHHTLRLLFYGLLSVVPGDASTPIYLVTAEFVTDAVAHVLDSGGLGVFHLSPDRSGACDLGGLLARVYAVFEADPDFRRRRILAPLLCDRESFDDLLTGAGRLGPSPVGQALESLAPFAEQLYIDKDVRNPRLREAWPSYAVPQPAPLVESVARWLTASRWGRRELVRS